MVTVALWVRLEAKPGKEADVDGFLRGGLPLVQAEPATTALMEKASDLLAQPPTIEKIDVLAAKLPG